MENIGAGTRRSRGLRPRHRHRHPRRPVRSRRSAATLTPPGRSAVSRSSSRRSPKASACWRSSSACSRSSSRSARPSRRVRSHHRGRPRHRGRHRARSRPADRGRRRGEAALFQINLFWVIVSAVNFLRVLRASIWTFAFKPVSKMLADRKERIEQGLKDAEQARRDRENAEAERVADPGRGSARGERDPGARPEGRPGDARHGHRRDQGGARAAARARHRRDRGREGPRDRRSSARRSPTWPSRPRVASSARR